MIDPESWLNTLCENDQVPTQVTNIKNSMFNTVRSRIGIKTSETAAKRYGVATLTYENCRNRKRLGAETGVAST